MTISNMRGRPTPAESSESQGDSTSLLRVEGVQHRFVDVGDGVTIHVAQAGPVDGPPVMLVHGFPQNWWEWRELIGPLAADGYRVLCPDLRGAGWSSAPKDRYLKADLADDLAAVLDRLGVGPVRLVAHDWGGPVAFLMMLRHPQKVSGLFAMNTVGPRVKIDFTLLLHQGWRFWYQIPLALPVLGPRVIGDPKGRYLRMLARWGGGGFVPPGFDQYVERLGKRGRAVAGSRWYRTYFSEVPQWRREYANTRVDVPVRWLHGTADPSLTPTLLRGYGEWISDFQLETVDGAGHWIVDQRPDVVLDRLRAFLPTS